MYTSLRTGSIYNNVFVCVVQLFLVDDDDLICIGQELATFCWFSCWFSFSVFHYFALAFETNVYMQHYFALVQALVLASYCNASPRSRCTIFLRSIQTFLGVEGKRSITSAQVVTVTHQSCVPSYRQLIPNDSLFGKDRTTCCGRCLIASTVYQFIGRNM